MTNQILDAMLKEQHEQTQSLKDQPTIREDFGHRKPDKKIIATKRIIQSKLTLSKTSI